MSNLHCKEPILGARGHAWRALGGWWTLTYCTEDNRCGQNNAAFVAAHCDAAAVMQDALTCCSNPIRQATTHRDRLCPARALAPERQRAMRSC
jgi:hypothetical protein